MAIVTKEAVFSICERVKQSTGREPTLEEIRAALGGGSDRDISRNREDWREADSKKAELANQPPADVQRAIDEAGRRIWAEAQRLANAMLAAAREENELRVAQLQSDKQEILASSAAKEVQIEELTQQLEAANGAARGAAAEAERQKGALLKQEEIAKRQDDVIAHLRKQVIDRSMRGRPNKKAKAPTQQR